MLHLIFAASESILIYRILVDSSLPSCRRYTRKACECCSDLGVTRTQKFSSERRKREVEEPVKVPESKRPRLHDDDRQTSPSPSSMDIDEEPEKEQEDIVEQQSKKTVERSVVKQSLSGDRSFKENPYIYLSPDDPALISCRYYPTTFPCYLWLNFNFQRPSPPQR